MTVIMTAAMMVVTMVMTVISVSSEAAVEELRRLLLLLLGCAVQVITHAHACTRTHAHAVPRLSWWSGHPGYTKVAGCCILYAEVSLGKMLNTKLRPRRVTGYYS